MMYLGNDFIESIALNREQISKPGYLGSFKRQLKAKYEGLLQETAVAPEFLVVNPIRQAAERYGSPSLS